MVFARRHIGLPAMAMSLAGVVWIGVFVGFVAALVGLVVRAVCSKEEEPARRGKRLAWIAFVAGGFPIVYLVLGLCLGAGMVMSSLVFLATGIVLGVAAIAVGHVARGRAGRLTERSAERLAGAGFGLGWLDLVLVAVLFFSVVSPWYAVWRIKAQGYSCQGNLHRLGFAFKMYASENQDVLPFLSPEPGRLMVDNERSPLYPEYLNDLCLFVCPSDKANWEALCEQEGRKDPATLCDDYDFFYLGYVVSNDAEVEAFAEAYRAQIARGGDFSADLAVAEGSGSGGGNRLFRLSESPPAGIASDSTDVAAIAKWQSQVPVLIERPGRHTPPGANVLYLDGHVEFRNYPGAWPMTEKTIGILTALAE